MSKISLFLRSIIYDIFICFWSFLIPVLYSKSFITKDRKLADRGAKKWAKVAISALEKICNIKYEIRGLENLPQKSGFLVASKHQSMWDTIILMSFFNQPAYAWKKELTKIPFYGWFITVMSGITVDREGGAKALKHLLNESKKYFDNGQNVVIFPQGTRTKIGDKTEEYPYQPGVAAIYNHCKVPVVPVALNSGIYWNKKDTKAPGTIILEFLPPIELGLDKKTFMDRLEKAIEDKADELCKKPTNK